LLTIKWDSVLLSPEENELLILHYQVILLEVFNG